MQSDIVQRRPLLPSRLAPKKSIPRIGSVLIDTGLLQTAALNWPETTAPSRLSIRDSQTFPTFRQSFDCFYHSYPGAQTSSLLIRSAHQLPFLIKSSDRANSIKLCSWVPI
jgi:hypothetical protein